MNTFSHNDINPSEAVPPGTPMDVLIIGAGLGGSAVANVLAREGVSVAMVDPHQVYPAEFRAEKAGPPQMALFDGLGLGAIVREVMTPMEDNHVYRFGRLMARIREREYGFAYADLVNCLRRALPDRVRLHASKVSEIATGPDRQRVTLANGEILDARLVVLSTGLGDAVRRSVGIQRVETSKAHSLSIGFTMAAPKNAFAFDTLNYFGKGPEDKVAYLTLFPIGDTMRGNLFTYHQANEPWTKALRANPKAVLSELMPEIIDACQGFEVAGAVELRVIDLSVTENYRRDGVVLIGDAFASTCPVPGVGILRVMTDVAQLCTIHLPQWLKTPGMDAGKIAAFYDDPVKCKMDAESMQASLFSRSMTVGRGAVWTFRRLRNGVARRLIRLRNIASGSLKETAGTAAALLPEPPGSTVDSHR